MTVYTNCWQTGEFQRLSHGCIVHQHFVDILLKAVRRQNFAQPLQCQSVVWTVWDIQDFYFHSAPLRLDFPKTVSTGQRPLFFPRLRFSCALHLVSAAFSSSSRCTSAARFAPISFNLSSSLFRTSEQARRPLVLRDKNSRISLSEKPSVCTLRMNYKVERSSKEYSRKPPSLRVGAASRPLRS